MNELMAAKVLLDVAGPDRPAGAAVSGLSVFGILVILVVGLATLIFLGLILAVIIICVRKSKKQAAMAQPVMAAAPLGAAEPAGAAAPAPQLGADEQN